MLKMHITKKLKLGKGDTSLDRFNKGVFSISNGIFDEFLKISENHFMEFLSNLPDQIYYEKFRKIKDDLMSKVNNTYRRSGNSCVLNHGDFHINNIMVKFNEAGQLQKIMLVDFQFCVVASIAIDVIYLLYLICDSECRARRDEVIYLYHSKFVDVLKSLGFAGRILSLSELHIELLKHKHLELFVVAALLPFMCDMAAMKDLDPEELMSSGDSRKIFYKNPSYTEELKSILPMLLHKGYFDG